MIPKALRLQEWNGTGWIGVVPFRMSGVMRRPLPDIPCVSAFPELNVRTYVEYGGKAGVWFFSLDAGSRLAVRVARALFDLPYYHARFRVTVGPDRVEYRAERADAGRVRFRATYRPIGQPSRSLPGALEHWLTERYCLYAVSSAGRIMRTDVHHAPWALQPAEAEIGENDMVSVLGVETPASDPLLHFSRRMDVVAWSPAGAE